MSREVGQDVPVYMKRNLQKRPAQETNKRQVPHTSLYGLEKLRFVYVGLFCRFLFIYTCLFVLYICLCWDCSAVLRFARYVQRDVCIHEKIPINEMHRLLIHVSTKIYTYEKTPIKEIL